MAKTIPVRVGDRDRPHWLLWSAFPFQTRFALAPPRPASSANSYPREDTPS